MPGIIFMSLFALGAICVLTIIPGMGITVAVWKPGEISFVARLGVATALGYSFVGLLSTVLAVLHGFYPVAFFVTVTALTAGSWYLGFRRASLREHLEVVGREIQADRWSLVVALLVLMAIAAIRLGFTAQNFSKAPGFRYWADGMELADSHGIPTGSLQYGSIYPPAPSKIVLTGFNASMSFVIGRDPFRALPPLFWLGSVGLALALWSLGRQLGLRITAPLLPVLLIMNRVFLNQEMSDDLTTYRAEVFGRLVAIAALILIIRALQQPVSRREIVFAGVLLGAGAGTHLLPVVVVVVMAALYGGALLFRKGDVRRILRSALAIGAVGAFTTLIILLVPRGNVGFGGVTQSTGYAEFRRSFHVDPTVVLATGNLRRGMEPPPRGPWYYPPGTVFREFSSDAVGAGLSTAASVALAMGTLALAVAAFLWLPTELRPLGPMAWWLGAALLGLSLLFSYRYNVFVFASFGLRRLFDYNSITLVILGLTFLEAGIIAMKRSRPSWTDAGAALLVLVIAASLLPAARADPAADAEGRRLLATVRWIRQNTPCTARILANRRTIATFETTTGRVGVLEGMAPYFRPDILRQVFTLLVSAKEFFRDPGSNRGFLQRQGIDFVIVVHGTFPLGFLSSLLRSSAQRLQDVPFLRPVYRAPGVAIFRVVGLPKTRFFPTPLGRPGYRCIRDHSIRVVQSAQAGPGDEEASGQTKGMLISGGRIMEYERR